MSTSAELLDEQSIVQRAASGDRSAFTSLMRRYNRRLYRLARATLRNESEAQDALQDAYLNAYRSMSSFRGESSIATWLSRLVLNECLARLRRTKRRENVIPIVSTETHLSTVADVADESELPEMDYGRSQMRGLLESKVEKLPEAFRLVFVLRSVEELTVEEVAQVLGIPEETVRSRHFRAKGLLRESLAREMDLAERDLFDFGGPQCDAEVARVLEKIPQA